MSSIVKTAMRLFLLVTTAHFHSFHVCSSKSVRPRSGDSTSYRIQESASTFRARADQEKHRPQGQQRSVEQVSCPSTRKCTQLRPLQLRPDSASNPREQLLHISELNLKAGINSTLWVIGNVSVDRGSSAPAPEDGYQADFTGFPEVQRKVVALSSDPGPRFSALEAMHPLVKCDKNDMTFTASGQGLSYLLVDREGASPISVFQLPQYCGYSVKATWSNLEMIVPYDGCFITQENGNYVLHMLWLGSLLKMSCPIMAAASPLSPPSSPSVFCSPDGMAVQIRVQKQGVPVLGVLVNGTLSPFVSELCAFQVDSQPQDHIFIISHSAPCITVDNGPQLKLVFDHQEYVLSCPVIPQFTHTHSPPQDPPSSPGVLQLPLNTDPARTVPTSPLSTPSQTQNQEQAAQLPGYPYYPYPGLQYHQLPQVNPSAPQSSHPLQPTISTPPESQQQRFQYPSGPGMSSYAFSRHLRYPPPHNYLVRDHFPHQFHKLSNGPSPYNPHLPYHYIALTPTIQKEPKLPPSSYHPEYHPLAPYQPTSTATPGTQAPAPLPSPSPLKQPTGPQHQTSPQFPYYPQWPVFHPASHPSAPAGNPTASTSGSSSQSYVQSPSYFPLPTDLPPAREKPQKPEAPQDMCLSSSDPSCSDYPYHHIFHPQHYDQPYPSLPSYPQIQPPVTKIPSTTIPWLGPQTPYLQCLKGKLVVLLPFADPDSIQVRDHLKTWLLLSSVSQLCGYMLQRTTGHGVILLSPLPACHSQLQPPASISLPIRYWDLSIWQNKTWDLRCPYQSVAETPAPAVPSISPPSPSTTKDEISPFVTRTKVFCFSQQMTVLLPPGPVSEIAVKGVSLLVCDGLCVPGAYGCYQFRMSPDGSATDVQRGEVEGNQVNLLEAPKDCGYYADVGKDGKINLILQLHSHCHMSVQGANYVITVIYMTESGRKEAHVSCPVVIPRSENECNLHSEYRLPCGSSSVSQTQCLSMGCCFDKHPPACYYPMDECTIDRRMIFYVPASLTDPPLSPGLLVAANNSTCKPQKATSEYALFNIPMDGCGTRRVVVSKTVVYMVEITNVIQTVGLNYGIITRDSPVRLLVECRYVPGTSLSVSYVVKTPTLGPEIHTQGVFGVQLRIAKDAHYNSYYPQYHQPLHMLLGKPLHLEVRLLNSPDPSLVLLVHFCVAYPRSGKAVWVLLYNGCPNPLDPEPPKTVLAYPKPAPSPQSQTRRFTISTFQFLPDGEFQDMDEEVYFMCSTEICSPRDGPCVEGCFGH